MCFVRGPASALANVEASEISNSIHLLYKYENTRLSGHSETWASNMLSRLATGTFATRLFCCAYLCKGVQQQGATKGFVTGGMATT